MGTGSRKGWLARLFGGSFGGQRARVTVRKSEMLDLTVPAAHADVVSAAVERWLGGHGVTAGVTTEHAGDKTHIRAKLGEADASRLDLADEAVQSELQDVIADAVR
jgi:hypothetical protein